MGYSRLRHTKKLDSKCCVKCLVSWVLYIDWINRLCVLGNKGYYS